MARLEQFLGKKKGSGLVHWHGAPAIYRIPPDQDIVKICEAVFRSSSTAIYAVEEAMVEEFKLHQLTCEEMGTFG